ncbi:MAG TPA: hypothetical protein VGK09_02600 [Rhodocyclaceae bacterium]|jgi:tryptophan-rich sensory protein
MDKHPIYLIKQFVRVVSLLAAIVLTLGMATFNLSLLFDLLQDPSSGGMGTIVWPVWIVVWLLIIGCAFSARATWQQIVAAYKAQSKTKSTPPPA